MPLLKIWKRIKKPILVGVVILISIFSCFLALHITNGVAEKVISGILGSFYAVVVFSTPLSVVIFNYIDGVSKDIYLLEADSHKIDKILELLEKVKKEVIANACLILALLFMDLIAKGIADSIPAESTPFELFYWTVLSVRFSIFILAILTVSDQIRGLYTAIEYRRIIHNGKKFKK